MFIEVTDLLRCPAEHDEAYLVLLPEVMEGREVTAGRLGCPVCHAEYPVREGVAELGPPPAVEAGAPRLDGGGVAALLGATLLLDPLGFRLTLALFCAGVLLALGIRRPWVVAVFALAGGFGVFHVFYHWLKVPLPIGLLGI